MKKSGNREKNGDRWDFERAERQSSARPARAVVSVAFNRPDFDQVCAAAEALDMKVSEFIRAAALAQAGQQLNIRLGTELDVSQAHWSYVSPSEENQESTASEGRHPMKRTAA